jgi:hypothetical protein
VTPSIHPSFAPHSITSSVSREQGNRYIKAERRSSLEVDDQFELGCKLHRKFSRLFPLENTIDVRRGASVKGGEIHTVGRQAAARDVETVRIHGRQPMLRRERSDQFSMDDGYWIR